MTCKMLNEEVKRLKGEAVASDEFDTKINIDASAYIPEKYIKNEVSRLEMYKRIASLISEEDVSELKDELIDRYGEMPDALDNLINISFIRELAHKAGITAVDCGEFTAKFFVYSDVKLDTDKVGEVIAGNEGKIKVRTGKETYFEYKFGDGVHKIKTEEKIKNLMRFAAELADCRQKEEVKEG